ncbi:DUF6059 family protein [Streptomyces sp. NPDC088810]|uniref:DUF6059 family protein n=1 Tax=unclassified Streptomyces TaxID=2593676 RepID=UPI003811FE55
MSGALLWRCRVLVLLDGAWRALTAYGSFWVAPGHPEYTALLLRTGDPAPGHPERRGSGAPLRAEERALARRLYGGDRRRRRPRGHEHRPRGTP